MALIPRLGCDGRQGHVRSAGIDLGPLAAEEVEVQVEHCGLCHSDVSVRNNEWGFPQFPAVLGTRLSAAWWSWPGRQGPESRTAGWRRLDGQHLHALPALHVGRSASMSTSSSDDSRPSRRIRRPRACTLGLVHPAARQNNCRRCRAPSVRRGNRLQSAGDVCQPTSRVGIVGIGGLGHMGVKFASAYGCE